MTSDVVIATNTFSFTRDDGAAIVIRKGETFHVEAERLASVPDAAREENFAAFAPGSDIERATAAPGERRKKGAKGKAAPPATPKDETGSSAGEDKVDYSGMKMAELKAELGKRGVEYSAPPGTSKADLVVLLEANDKKQQG